MLIKMQFSSWKIILAVLQIADPFPVFCVSLFPRILDNNCTNADLILYWGIIKDDKCSPSLHNAR